MRQKITDLVLTVIASTTLLSGCAISAIPDEANPGFEWVNVGTNANGCSMFTKKSTTPNVVVDSAIWYLDANGHYVLDANSCIPSSSNGVLK